MKKKIAALLVTACALSLMPSAQVYASDLTLQEESETPTSKFLKSLEGNLGALEDLATKYRVYDGICGEMALTTEQQQNITTIIKKAVEAGKIPDFMALAKQKDGKDSVTVTVDAVAKILNSLISVRQETLTDEIRKDPSKRAELNKELSGLYKLDTVVMNLWSQSFVVH
ncbi:MAG: hypothetical protein C0514_06640 [Candidatus Puniceispirillum sp.]|nr:hypothetical protein [Candidatus Puniceispirillum sp.]